jgi:hypothetical protein
MPLEQLINETFLRCEPGHYFRKLDETHPEVVRFRDLITRKDAEALSREWPSLSKSFLRMEAAIRARDNAPTRGRSELAEFCRIFGVRWKIIAERLKRRK